MDITNTWSALYEYPIIRHVFVIAGIAGITWAIAVSSCGRDVNSIADPNFDSDGAPLDTAVQLFTLERPKSANFMLRLPAV